LWLVGWSQISGKTLSVPEFPVKWKIFKISSLFLNTENCLPITHNSNLDLFTYFGREILDMKMNCSGETCKVAFSTETFKRKMVEMVKMNVSFLHTKLIRVL